METAVANLDAGSPAPAGDADGGEKAANRVNWEKLLFAAVAIVFVLIIMLGTAEIYHWASDKYPGSTKFIGFVSFMFMCLALSILLVVALNQSLDITWDKWKLGGVFAGIAFFVAMYERLPNPFVEINMQPNLAQIFFECADKGGNFIQNAAQSEDISISTIAVAIYDLDAEERGNFNALHDAIRNDLTGYKEMKIIDQKTEGYAELKEKMKDFTKKSNKKSWVAYEVDTASSEFQDLAESYIPIALPVATKHPTVLFAKTKFLARPGNAVVAEAVSETQEKHKFEPFARLALGWDRDDRKLGHFTFNNPTKLTFYLGSTPILGGEPRAC